MFNNSTFIDLGLGSRVRILEGFGLTLVFFISLMLNISVCVIIWTTKPLLAKPSNILVGNLCIANLLLTACGIPFSLVTIIKDQHDAYSHSILCQGNGFISVTSSFAIVMTLCCICLDRYIAVTRPTRYKVIVTIKRSKFALVVVWCEGLLHASFPLLGWSKYVYHKETLHCSPKWTHNCSIYVYLAVIGFGLPIVSMVFTYIRIVSVMRKHTRKVLTVRQRGLDGEKKESTSELISMTPRQSMDRNSSVPAKQEVQEKLPSSTQNPSRSEGVEAVSSSLMKICSIESYSCEPTDQKVEKCVTACKLTPGNAIINSRSPRQRFQCLSLRNILIRYFPKKQCGQNMQPLTKEWKVAKTGVILLVSFIVLWLPYMVVHTCSARFKAPQVVFRLSMWLVFMNGVVNPVAYAFGNSRVKMKFQKWFSTIFFLFCKCRRKEHNNRNLKTSDR